MNSILTKVVLSWIVSFGIFMICWMISTEVVSQYVKSIPYAMMFGLVAYKISDTIAAFVLENLIYSIKQRN